jgi:hypothetical protein
MRTAACLLLSLLALSAVADASKLGDALKERLDDMPKVTAADGGRPLVCPLPAGPQTCPCRGLTSLCSLCGAGRAARGSFARVSASGVR